MTDFGVRRWKELGVVDTIYEEENEDSLSSSSSMPSFESSPSLITPKNSRMKESRSRSDPDVVIHVQGSSFRLHKDTLIARSAYLKRHLSEIPELTLSPPLNITPQTFTLVTDFCYGTHIAVTPFNVAALRLAAELLDMTETAGSGDENLRQITEDYFRRVVAVTKECATIVLRSCFPLLPEAETMAFLVSRCVEALSLTAEDDDDVGYLEGFKSIRIEDLKLIVESVSQRLPDRHDVLYRIIDTFLKENMGRITEEEKIQICNYIDCSILSPDLIMHAVQNPRMPLRFVVQAMFLQQLDTRRFLVSAAADHHHHHHHLPQPKDSAATTLGAILERDAALRQVSQLKTVMSATNSRIQTLEKELSGMKKLLTESEIVDTRVDSARSASFRFSSESTNKVERGQVGSMSSLSYRDAAKKVGAKVSSSSDLTPSEGSPAGGGEKKFGRRLINGLKSAFRLQKKRESKGQSKSGEKLETEDGGDEGKVVIVKKDRASHVRNASI